MSEVVTALSAAMAGLCENLRARTGRAVDCYNSRDVVRRAPYGCGGGFEDPRHSIISALKASISEHQFDGARCLFSEDDGDGCPRVLSSVVTYTTW